MFNPFKLREKKMTAEQKFLSGLADIVLRIFDDPEMSLTKVEVCRDGHFSPKMLTHNKILHSSTSTFMRLMLYLALLMNEQELFLLFHEMARYITQAANDDDFTAYDIIDAHTGSRIAQNV